MNETARLFVLVQDDEHEVIEGANVKGTVVLAQ